jgi:mRNA interferase MazF
VGGNASKSMSDQIMAADKARLKVPLGRRKRADILKVESALSLHLGLPR